MFAHCSELKSTHESELKRPETNGTRMHANNYEPGNLDKRTNAKHSAPKFSYSPVGRMSDFITVPTFNHSFEVIRAGTFSSDDCPIGAQLLVVDWPIGVQLVIFFISSLTM